MSFEENIKQIIANASDVIAPIWPIKSFVACNPLQGFEELPFEKALKRVSQIYDCRLYATRKFFLDAIDKNELSEKLLKSSFELATKEFAKQIEYKNHSLDISQILWNILLNSKEFELVKNSPKTKLISSNIKDRSGNLGNDLLNGEVIKWCAAFFDEGQAAWNMPGRKDGLFNAWKQLAIYDKIIAENVIFLSSPSDSTEAIIYALKNLNIKEDDWEEYLRLHLSELRGWAGFVKWRQDATNYQWQQIAPAAIADYLAIRLLTEIAIINNSESVKIKDLPKIDANAEKINQIQFLLKRYANLPENDINEIDLNNADKIFKAIEKFDLLLQGKIWLEAFEGTYRNSLLTKLHDSSNKAEQDNYQLPDSQLIFCIDTRSEPYRKAIETLGNYQTFGSAGFFGLPISYKDPSSGEVLNLCPGLLSPKCEIAAKDHQESDKEAILCKLRYAYFLLKRNISASFAFIAAIGPICALIMLRKTLFNSFFSKVKPAKLSDLDLANISDALKLSYCRDFLRSIALTDNFAKIILLCGHGSATANNLYASSLDCGACSGNHGAINAIAMANILNDKEIRSKLALESINIPADSVFIGAEHNTTTDELVTFEDHINEQFDKEALAKIKQDIAKAEVINYNRRFDYFDNHASSRDSDWAQVRPEWGLARNAAFIIANRSLTKKIDLEGRSFLHSYDHQQDPDGSILSAIMGGPMVVGQWINYQYYFSTIDNTNHGSGSKVTKNMVGKIGVMQGNNSDLMHGLALQSVMKNDQELFHQPLRLTVIIAAPKLRLNEVISKQEVLQRLFYNGWIKLVAIEPESDKMFILKVDGSWDLWIK